MNLCFSRRLQLFIPTFAVVFTSITPLHAKEIAFSNSGSAASIIELYSSEGCSSCPPAETWISKLKTSPELWKSVFPMVFHVDYWDNLGWPDRFATPAYTQRQHDYATKFGSTSVYTPEFIVNGREWQNSGLNSLPTATTSGMLSLHGEDSGKNVSALFTPASPGFDQTCEIHVALLGSNITSSIRGGENGGRQLLHDFVVLDFATKLLTKNNGYKSDPIGLKSSTSDAPAAVAAWVTDAKGSVLQVTGGWL